MDRTTGSAPELPYSVKQLEMAVRSRLDSILAEFDISTPQYTALTVLERRPGLTSAALARRSFVSAQAMSEVVLALERKGLIDRTTDPSHARRLIISLTEPGRSLLKKARVRTDELQETMVAGLDDSQVAWLQEWLASSTAALRAE